MKYIISVFILSLSINAFAVKLEKKKDREPASANQEKEEYQQVRGHVRSNGTYVAPYIRTSPNGNPYDNIRPKK